MNRLTALALTTSFLVPGLLNAQPEPDVAPPRQKGIYAIWYGEEKSVLDLPFVHGGQIVLQWADVEPRKGKYDFSAIDEQLKNFSAQKRYTTIQVNGNIKPAWMFEVIPHHPEKLSHQIRNEEGTLMYWHPEFIQDYIAFIHAYAAHLKSSPYLSVLAGVRMNFNALGTEHFPIPADKTALAQWITPSGVAQGQEWTTQISEDYQNRIMDEFIRAFTGIPIWLRNNISDEMLAKYRKDFEEGRLMLFHTSSEMEPRGVKLEHNYHLFYEYARSGRTLAYAEPWAGAWGEHGPKVDKRWTGPAQWTYWRLLNDLHCGVSIPAVYANDLIVAQSGRRRKGEEALQYQAEFTKAFRFADAYAGFHASPSVAPGAWVAFRHNDRNRMTGNELAEFTGNYSFLARQTGGEDLKWQNVINVGPDTERYGAWAEVLPAGKSVGAALSPAFVRSVQGKASNVRVIYYDGAAGSFETVFGSSRYVTELKGSARWKTVEFPVAASAYTADAAGAHVTVHAINGDITLHMINVERGNGLPGEVQSVTARKSGQSLRVSWKAPQTPDLQEIRLYDGSSLVATVDCVTEEVELRGISGKSVTIRTVDEAGRESAGITQTF